MYKWFLLLSGISAGTLSGNPMAMTAGLQCYISEWISGAISNLEKITSKIVNGFKAYARAGVNFTINHWDQC